MVSDQFIHDFLATLITFLVVAYLLRLLVRRLARSRDGLRIGTPVAAALGIRILAAAAIGQLSVAATLRGGDEVAFLARAHSVATTSPGSPVWNHELTHELHVVVLGIQKALLDSPDFALRIGQAGLAVAGLVLLATAIYELAGPRAALIGAWLLALEPTNIFFSTIIHKESIMMLATGLVAYGGAIVWKRSELRAFVPIVLGCLIALATRYYAGYFLIAASAAITLHAGIRARRESSTRALVLVALVVMLGAISGPFVWQKSSRQSLQSLQNSQNANASDQSNLSLERVNFSTRGELITNLPTRIVDITTKPYPWQLGSASQRFGLLGTTVFLVIVYLLIRALWRNRGSIMERAGPLVYIGFFLLLAYSLSAGNAGTAFRYRTHIVALALCLLVTLTAARWQESREAAARPFPRAREPLPSH